MPPGCPPPPQGYLSYPRTESTAYPPNFDFHTLLAAQRAHPIWGEFAASLVGSFSVPKGGESRDARFDVRRFGPSHACTVAVCGGTTLWRLEPCLARPPAHLQAAGPPSSHTAGTDVGDHPPITPVRCATEAELGGGDAWRLYE